MSLFQVKLPVEGKEYIDAANDILLVTVSLLFAHLIFKSCSNNKNIFDSFPEFYVYILMGVMYHHLVIKKIITFV